MERLNEVVREAEGKMPKAFSDALNRLALEREESLFKVPLLGGMKAGKSTLLSKLLECDQAFLPPGVLESTARCVRIGYGFVAVRRVVRADGSETMIETDEEWDSLVRGKAPLSDGDSLVIDLPSDFLRQGNLVLLDTPGNNTMDEAKEKETWAALSGSQLAVYCLRATEILTKTDLQFLQTVSHKLKNFIFVVTRLDEAGIRDASSQEGRSLLEYVSQRLSETFGVQPLAIVATSSRLDDSVSGIPALKDLIKNVLAEGGERLRLQRFAAEAKSLVQSEMSRVSNALSLLKRGLSESEDVASAQIGAFKAQLVENEEERTRAIKRLATELEGRRLTLRQDISAAAGNAIERLKGRLEGVKFSSELENGGTGMILSEVDRWQEEVREKVSCLSQAGDELMAGAAEEFLCRLNASARGAVGDDFKVVLADADQYEVSAYRRDELKRLVADGKNMESEIAELEANLGSEADQIPELRASLDAVRTEMERLAYVPQYVEKRFGTVDGGMEDALSKVGQFVDWALLLAPVPGSKLRWLTKLKYGKNVKKVIDGANKLIRAKNRFIKKSGKMIPGFAEFVDMLSVEHWAGKLGHAIDESGVETKMVEDPEVRKAYDDQVAFYRGQESVVLSKIIGVQETIALKQRQLEQLKSRRDGAVAESEQLERDIHEQERLLVHEREQSLLEEGKRQLVSKAMNILVNPASDLRRSVVDELDKIFSTLRNTLIEDLVRRMNATLETVSQQLAMAEESWKKTETDRKAEIDVFVQQKEYLECLRSEISLV